MPRTMTAKKRRSAGRGECGFSLLEVMIATGVTSVGFVLLLGSLVNISDAGDLSQARAVATSHASSVVEEIRGMGLDALLAYEAPGFEGLGEGEDIQVRCFNADGDPLALPLGDGVTAPELPNPMEIQVTVLWRDNKGRVFSKSASMFHGR